MFRINWVRDKGKNQKKAFKKLLTQLFFNFGLRLNFKYTSQLLVINYKLYK